jgi:hypothetical protein
MANYHVVQNPDGDWAAERENSERASSNHNTQAEALEAARRYTINSGGGEVNIHGTNGRIRDKNTYGKSDPYPPKG